MTQVMGRQWMVAAGHPLAAQAAARVLAAGGNAVDAGVAAGFMLGVVHPDMVSFAGVAPILVHLASTGETYEVSGVGPYPRRASAEYFRTQHGGDIPIGLLRTVVPSAPDSWCVALERWGTLTFTDAVSAALECAEHGFPTSAFSASIMASNAERYRRFPTSAAIFLPGGKPHAAGQLFVQSELAATIKEMVAAELRARSRGRAGAIRAARDAFYKGDIAARIADYHAREGGLLTREDLAEFQAEVAPALKTTFHDYEVASCGFWCQGPVFLQMLNLIEAYDWPALGHNSPRGLHIMVEAMKLAFADREAYYGDPRFVKVPAEALLSKVYAELRRGLIREDRAWPEMPPPGDPEGKAAVRNGHGAASTIGAPSHAGTLDTSYVSVIDAEGNAFSATPSDPGGVDSPVVPGRGLRGLAAGLPGLARARASERGGGRQAAAPHPGALAGPARRSRLHGLRHARRRRPAAGHAPGAAEHDRLRHGPAAGGGGAAGGHALLPRFVLAARQLPRAARRRGAHRARDARGPGRPRARHRRLARLRLAGRRGLRLGGRQGRGAARWGRPAPRRPRHRVVAARSRARCEPGVSRS